MHIRFDRMGLALVFMAQVAPAAAQSRQPVVAVVKMDDLANSGQSAALSTMILSAIAQTQKFKVIEREQMGTLVKEQALGRSGMTTSRNRGKIGGFEGADYLIYGSITALSARKKTDFGTTMLLGGLTKDKNGAGGQTCYSGEVSLSLDIKITDRETGQIRYVKRLDEIQKSGTICGTGVPESNAVVLFRSAADKVATGLVTTVFPIKVADVSADGTITLNYGEGAVKIGDKLTIFVPGKVILDPDNGQPMGNSETRLGLVQITDVQSRLSKAKAISGFASQPEVKSVARIATVEDLAFFKSDGKKRR